MSMTRTDYGSGVSRPKIEEKDSFELKGQFLKELRENTFSGSDNEDANEHIEKVLEIQEPDETLYQAWERFKELLMKCPQHYLTGMQEVILFYNGLDVPTRQILDSRGAIPTKTAADAKKACWELKVFLILLNINATKDGMIKTRMKTPPLDQTEGRKEGNLSVHAEEPSHTVEDSGIQQDQEFITGDNNEKPADKEVTKDKWFKKPERPPTPDPDWSKRRQVDFQPPQTWISQAALAKEPPTSFDEFNYTLFDFSAFVMNRLKIPNLTQEILVGPSPVVVKYDQHAYYGTSHWGPKRQSFYGYASNLTSSKDVYSRRRIIAVTRLIIMKKYDYSNLEKIEVRRDDQQLYTFKEGDFKRLRLQDIEDMLLLLVQQKLANLTIDEQYYLNVALRPHGIIYVDQFKRKRLMRTDELHKFSDGTLNDVRTALHDIVTGIGMEYPPMRKYSNLDKKRVRVMVQDIDKQLYQRRLMRNLEIFVGERIYG
ncbi:hypothetical protein Tco_0809012, partial [Tanacetum coccineum]